MSNVQQASEELFKAIDILTSKQISGLEFDKTLICTIESVENKKNGAYRVSSGSSTFLAYSLNAEYSAGQKVYVQIPNGDMSNQKIITGKYVSEDNDYTAYVSPLNSFVDVSGNLIKENLEYSLKANDNNRKSIVVFQTTGKKYIGYERLGLSGDFKVPMGMRVNKGGYGLRLDVTERTESGLNNYHSFYLDSQDMYGNPYNFSTFYKQEQMFDISHIKEIVNMRLVFYQNSDFYYEDSTYVGENDTDYSIASDNIILQKPYISLGYDVSKFTEDTVLLGTHDDLMYSNLSSPQQRSVYMRWVHKDGDRFYAVDESEEIPENAVIHWYQYKIEQNRSDKLAGYFWKEFSTGDDKFNYSFIPDYNVSEEGYKVIIEYPSREIVNAELQKELTGDTELSGYLQGIANSGVNFDVINAAIIDMCREDDIEGIYETTKSVYLQDNETALNAFENIYSAILNKKAEINYYTSKPLYFTNSITQEQEAIDLVQSLNIEVDKDNYEGVYRLYDETYNIINSVEANKMRTLKATYNSIITGETSLSSAETITWYIPVDNTMIHEPVQGKEYNVDPEDENSDIFLDVAACAEAGYPGYVGIRRRGVEIIDPPEDGVQLIEVEQQFRIKDYYTQTASNNTVYCEVKKRGRIYQAEALLLFGTSGANGTEATFLLKMYSCDNDNHPIDEVSALTLGESVIVVPELYDFNNVRINITNINYSWKERNNANAISVEKIGNNYKLTAFNNNISNYHYHILQATTEYTIINDLGENGECTERTVELCAYLPIAVRVNHNYIELEGATKIVYNSNGVNPKYYKGLYKLYGSGLEQIGVSWVLRSEDFINDSRARRYYPSLLNTGEFMPPKMYYTGLKPVCVYAFLGNPDNIVWTQPLLIIQNKYGSAMLNNWDGNLTIDEKNGTILSAMVGAGIKNEDNTFSGVLMGNMGKVSDDFDPNNRSGIGLYGLDHGAQSYGFNVDGTAFIGKSDKGRINFDGKNGTITSANYSKPSGGEPGAGMKIDLDDTILNAYGSAGSFEMNMESDTNEPLLRIKDFENKTLMYISGIPDSEDLSSGEGTNTKATKYYIQSSNYSVSKKAGLKLDLQNSQFTAFGEGGSIQIDAADKDHLFKIMGKGEEEGKTVYKPLINISGGESGYFLRSYNYNKNKFTGLNFDLSKGKLTAYDFSLYTAHKEDEEGNLISSIKIDSTGNPYFKIHYAPKEQYENVPVYQGVDEDLIYGSGKFFLLTGEDSEGKPIYESATGDFNYYSTYYTQVIKDDKIIYEEVEPYNPDYNFASISETLYTYSDEDDSYKMISTFDSNKSYYIKKNIGSENDLIKISRNKFELKSHNWDISRQTGMHFDISGNGGYIEGYGEYINKGGTPKHPKFILDWRKNRDPININNGVFRVKWNGEVTCTNIKASGGKIGGWKITDHEISSNNIILYSSSALSAIYAGPNAKNFKDIVIAEKNVNDDREEKPDELTDLISTDWNDLGLETDKRYFYVDDSGVLQAYIAQIQYLKAKYLYVENFYLAKKQVQWRLKKVVIDTSAKRVSVLTGIDISSAGDSTRHKHSIISESDTSYNSVAHSHSITPHTTKVISRSSDTKDQIIYLG